MKTEKSKYPIEEYSEEFFETIEKIIGFKIKKRDYFREAFTHSSARQVFELIYKIKIRSNERLEFIGDAVLYFCMTDIICKKFPDIDEGLLTNIRVKFIQQKTLCQASNDLNLLGLLKKSPSLIIDEDSKTNANLYEALIAAIYLDSGVIKSKSFIEKTLFKYLDTDIIGYFENYKSQLMEIFQASHKELKFVLINKTGPDHKPTFEVEVREAADKKHTLGYGKANTLKKAEQIAARKALSSSPVLKIIEELEIAKK
jgi:ribonuclease-3